MSNLLTLGKDPKTKARLCRAKFLRFFPNGFQDPKYHQWERGYKEAAHASWVAELDRQTHRSLLKSGDYQEIAERAVRIESRTNLLFSFEKMALRDAVKSSAGAKAFSGGLYAFLYGPGAVSGRFERWCEVVAGLPRKQTRVLTWPVVTVFGFLADPRRHIFFKPNVTKVAAESYGIDLGYRSRPNWETYASLLRFAERILGDNAGLHPEDNIDAQSFIWVQGSSEYDE